MDAQQLVQLLLAVGACTAFLLSVHKLARIKRLSFRYALGWIALGATGLVAAAVVPFASEIAHVLHLSPAGVLATGAVVLLVAICVQLSISISGIQEQTRLLAEELALLKAEKSSDGK